MPAMAAGTLRLGAPDAADLFMPEEDPDQPPVLAILNGACICYDSAGGSARGRCGVHRALGHAALPLACRQFPRISVRDPRGVSVTLSHYCPTAAGLLACPASRTAIVESAQGFPRDGEYDGLDARTNLPPLLRPDMLMDWESWSLWERLSVECLSHEATSAAAALSQIEAAVEFARDWAPQDGPLGTHLSSSFIRASTETGISCAADNGRRLAEVLSAIPRDLHAKHVEPRLKSRRAGPVPDDSLRRFLAAHAFANWTAHLGLGLRAWRRSIDAARALVSIGLGFDGADLLLRHLADPAALARVWSAAETDSSYSADMNG